MKDDVLEVMITEYKILRDEMYKNFDHQIRIFAIVVSALGVIYGIIFANKDAYDLFLFIPLISIPLFLRFEFSVKGVIIYGKYLEILENQIKKINNKKDWKCWTGYQNYYEKEHSYLIDKIYDFSARWLMFIFMPMVIAIWYSFTKNTDYSWLGWLYLFSIIISPFIIWIIDELAKEEIKKRKKREV